MNKVKVTVTVVTVVYGTRWPFLKQVAEACLSDEQVTNFVIVDNGCSDSLLMDKYASAYDHRVTILRQENNIGYSGAINKGLIYARETDCDYVLVLDDDSVPEKDAISYFMLNLKLIGGEKIVLSGNRVDVPGSEYIFTTRPLYDKPPRGTLFEVFSFKKLVYAYKFIFGIKPCSNYPLLPIVPTEAFVTGGSFLPIQLVREIDPPDASMTIYGEDLDYAWRIRRSGYQSYACARPIIRDVDMTFPNFGDHIFGLFKTETPAYKVYYRMRNSVVISRRHSDQSDFVLALNVIVWFIGLCIIGLTKVGFSKVYLSRVTLIAKALYTGFFPETKVPDVVKLPK